jgi:prepilin-type N-terminal cleavage/methylation domain-containing protein
MTFFRQPRLRGFSMTEMVIVVAVIGVLAAAVVSIVASGTIQGAREVRASQDEKVLNSAVLAYLASGGDLSGIEGGEAVLAKLKTIVSAVSPPVLPPPSTKRTPLRSAVLATRRTLSPLRLPSQGLPS